ncbi:hypothetical protein [Spiroplasma endosymbiont of Nebria brevicollis]|uniref:hypothetical protein n=1 Tax=Spiroplasma endosymbiont of Nebria brevicollis TaxID=3066284 RepID=UPI00313AD579
MRKILGLMAAIVLGSTTTLQVVACSDDSKFQDFKSYVNNNETFFGVLGIKSNTDEKALTDGLTTMQAIPLTGGKSQWEAYLESDRVKPALDKDNTKINILTFERGPFADESKTSADDFWNDSSISWQKNIYHWLIDHKTDANYTEPVTDSATTVVPTYPGTDKKRKFTSLPIIFIVSKGHLLTVGVGWDSKNISNQKQFFDKFTALISGNLLDKL